MTGVLSVTERGTRLLELLDLIPIEIRLEHILPHLGPETLVWLNKEFYIKHHCITMNMIPVNRSARPPPG